MMGIISLLCITYFFCAVPFGYIYAKVFCGVNLRKEGSGNIGATNVRRICGTFWGALTLFSDILKGVLPTLLAQYFYSSSLISSLVAGVAIFAHAYSPYLGFKGGKSVATTIGVWLVLAPLPLLWSIGICIFIIWRSGYVSAGSLALVLSLPILLLLFREYSYVPLSLALLMFVFLRHKDNIERITKGTEKRWR